MMTREQLRQKLIAAQEKVQTVMGGMIWRHMSDEERMLSTCVGREFWQADNPVTNAALDACVALINNYPT